MQLDIDLDSSVSSPAGAMLNLSSAKLDTETLNRDVSRSATGFLSQAIPLMRSQSFRPMLRWASVLTLLLAACVSLHSAVAGNSPSDRDMDKRFYIGASLGLSQVDPQTFCPCLSIDKSNDLAISLMAGIDISKRFSVEGYYSRLGAASVDFLGDSVGEIDYAVAGISGVMYLYNRGISNSIYDDDGYFLREGLSVYARLGVGIMENESDLDFTQNHDTHLSAGVGLEYGFANGFALRAEVNAFDTDARQVNASLIKRFGRSSTYAAPVTPVPTVAVVPKTNKPVVELPKVEAPSVLALAAPVLNFDFGRAELTNDAQQLLNDFVTQLRAVALPKLYLAGHTDSIDTETYNQHLSVRRVEAVRAYLIKAGVNSSAITVAGFGELQPIASNASSEGRTVNRRVEISLR